MTLDLLPPKPSEQEGTSMTKDELKLALASFLYLTATPPEQEPVATLLLQSKQNYERNFGPSAAADWIYSDLLELLNTTPPQRTWVDLTPQDLNDIFKTANTGEGAVYLALKIIRKKNLKEQA